MLIWTVWAILVALSVAWYFAVVSPTTFFGPATYFVIWHGLFVVGTFVEASPAESADLKWLGVVATGYCAFIVGCFSANCLRRFRPSAEIGRFRRHPTLDDLRGGRYSLLVIGIGGVALLVGILFAYVVGYNVIWSSIRAYRETVSFGRTAETYSSLRTGISYSGDRYVAPGYAMQFTAVLLPAVLYLILLRVRAGGRLASRFLLIAFGCISLFVFTTSGRRSDIIGPAFNLVLLMSPGIGPLDRRLGGRRAFLAAAIGLTLAAYWVTTILAGRGVVSESLEEAAAVPGLGLINDLGFGQARVQMTIMRGLLDGTPVWGAEWLNGLADLLPGHRTGFSQELHRFLYGSTRGSVGLGLWGGFWWNWGWIGVGAWSLVLGFLLQLHTIRLVRGRKTIFRTVVLFLAGLCLVSVRGPVDLFLSGFVTLLIYYSLWRLLPEPPARHARPILLPYPATGRRLYSAALPDPNTPLHD